MDPDDRVKIWNTFFKLALQSANDLHEKRVGKRDPVADQLPSVGDCFPEVDRMILAMILNCCIAIEARTKHLAAELAERGRLTGPEKRALKKANGEARWFLLPKLAGHGRSFDDKVPPHNSITKLWNIRNHVVHCNFEHLEKGLKETWNPKILCDFAMAMDELNVAVRGIGFDASTKAKFASLFGP